MPRKKAASWTRRRMTSAAALGVLAAAAFYTSFSHPPTSVTADVLVTGLNFVYHPIEPERDEEVETHLLSGVPFTLLSVRSFDSLDVSRGVLSVKVKDASGTRWEVIPTNGPIKIRRKDRFTKAMFTGGRIREWRFSERPAITLEFPKGQPVLNVLVESKDFELSLGGGDSIEFQCQLCIIDGVDTQAPSLPRELKLSELNQVALTASSGSAMTLNVIPGPQGFGNQQFRISQPWFCGGSAREPRSTMQSGTVTFDETGQAQTLSGRVVRLTPDTTFLVTSMGIRNNNELNLKFTGVARTAELSGSCTESGASFQPSLFDVLAKKPVVVATGSALAALFGWLALFDTAQGAWARTQPKERRK